MNLTLPLCVAIYLLCQCFANWATFAQCDVGPWPKVMNACNAIVAVLALGFALTHLCD